MIYVSSPYFNADPTVRQQRYEAVQKYCYELYVKGQWTYSPIVHYHPMAVRFNMDLDVTKWFNCNFQMLKLAEELHVLRLTDWDKVPGVAADIAFMINTAGTSKVKYINP